MSTKPDTDLVKLSLSVDDFGKTFIQICTLNGTYIIFWQYSVRFTYQGQRRPSWEPEEHGMFSTPPSFPSEMLSLYICTITSVLILNIFFTI